ncbi:exodeoxyribonuclease V subunit alpha [Mycolicibacterium fallax]|jgi:exodeoxyribonuclease V alpha subunit|uniref:exodeoxyribonuclease V subunit alpha n=1 Tax=Mycolicibacterium fallax TaxID=1793 RepID=UPI000A16A5CB|nr:exodeoxyribonuclease V subunit alpha [Mycolicibacterium fallax]BBY99114.1 RecBCD enzyme subunit RecD [Mycolicibacterium fallax]
MTMPAPPPTVEDPFDRRLALRAEGVLAQFNRAGVLEAADVHVAQRLCALAGEANPDVGLAVALAVRAVRNGSVCVDLDSVGVDLASIGVGLDSIGVDSGSVGVDLQAAGAPAGLTWPEPAAWRAAIRDSPLSGTPPVLRLEHDRLLYLDRYWREEDQVCRDLLERTAIRPLADGPAGAALEAGLLRVFHRTGSEEQREAARIALTQATTVLTGGPGTGKTTTVAGLLALIAEQAEIGGHRPPRIALAAPTGKASARLQQAVGEELGLLSAADRDRLPELHAVTIHRLLGFRPGSATRFRHHRGNRLPHDVVVVDETSMVSLTMMARLVEAIRPDARLILVGDPDQLTSVDAGAVLADLVDGLGEREDNRIARLRTSHRFGSAIGALASAIRAGDAEQVLALLRGGDPGIAFIEDPEPTAALRRILLPHALRLRSAALEGGGRAALDVLERHRLLCAHREGPFGVRHWNRQVERWIGDETAENLWADWYVGRPVLVTANDYGIGLYNGDTGVTVAEAGQLRVVIDSGLGPVSYATSRLSDVATMHAMTIHKSQGSQAAEITVLLPGADSRLLSRELFYTAVTRAKDTVRVVGTEDSVRAALDRRVLRASGLRGRLAGS